MEGLGEAPIHDVATQRDPRLAVACDSTGRREQEVTTGPEGTERGSSSDQLELRFRSDAVPWWSLFAAWISMVLGTQLPELGRTTIEIVPGDLITVAAIANGEADFGFTTPPVCATMGLRGVGWFAEKLEGLRAVASFPHDDRLIWAVPTELGVHSIEELRDARLRIALGGKGGPVSFAVDQILEAYGMPRAELEARGWEFKESDYLFGAVSMVTRGEADVIVHEGRKTPPWQQLLRARDMTFLPIREDVIAGMVDRHGFRRAVLSMGMLDGAVTEDLPTLDWSDWLLFTNAGMDEELVHRVTSIIVEYKHLFEWAFKGQPLEQSDLVWPIEPRTLHENVGIPLHPGAERYYREHGLVAAW